jgi:hypothetical protein
MKENDKQSHAREDEVRLMHLVSMFQIAAMQNMGKLVNPVTNETERDLAQAKASIDMIETIKRKTEGNRSDAETEFLDKVLFELHMNYVDEVDSERKGRAEGETKEEEESTATAAPESGKEDAGDGSGSGSASEETTDPEK